MELRFSHVYIYGRNNCYLGKWGEILEKKSEDRAKKSENRAKKIIDQRVRQKL